MHIYQIRVLEEGGETSFIAAQSRLNDNAAIRSATQLFGGKKFEIWRGMNCVYGTGQAPLPERQAVG